MDRADTTRLAADVVEPMVTGARALVTDGTSVLLVQERNRVWNLPGGGLAEADRLGAMEALEACARRELFEEPGIALTHFERMSDAERNAVYVAMCQRLSWSEIKAAYRRRRPTTEIRGVWWGALEAALEEPSVDDRAKIALTMWCSRSRRLWA